MVRSCRKVEVWAGEGGVKVHIRGRRVRGSEKWMCETCRLPSAVLLARTVYTVLALCSPPVLRSVIPQKPQSTLQLAPSHVQYQCSRE